MNRKKINVILLSLLSATMVAGCFNTGGSTSTPTAQSKNVNSVQVAGEYNLAGSILGAESGTYTFGTFGYKEIGWSDALGVSRHSYNENTGVWNTGDKYNCDLSNDKCKLNLNSQLAQVMQVPDKDGRLATSDQSYNGFVIIMNDTGNKLVGASQINYDEMDFTVEDPNLVATPLATSQYIIAFLRWKYNFSLDQVNSMFTAADIENIRKAASGTGLEKVISKSSIWYFYLVKLQEGGKNFPEAMNIIAEKIKAGRNAQFISEVSSNFQTTAMAPLLFVFETGKYSPKRKGFLDAFVEYTGKVLDFSAELAENAEAMGGLISPQFYTSFVESGKRLHQTLSKLVGGSSSDEQPINSPIAQAELEEQRWNALLSNSQQQTQTLNSMYALQKLEFEDKTMNPYRKHFVDLLNGGTGLSEGIYGKYLAARGAEHGNGTFDSQIEKVKSTFNNSMNCQDWVYYNGIAGDSSKSQEERAAARVHVGASKTECIADIKKLNFKWFNSRDDKEVFNFGGNLSDASDHVKAINDSDKIKVLMTYTKDQFDKLKESQNETFDHIVSIKKYNSDLQSWAYKIVKANRFFAQYLMVGAKIYKGGSDGWGNDLLQSYVQTEVFSKTDWFNFSEGLKGAIIKVQGKADTSNDTAVQLLETYAENPYDDLNQGLLDLIPKYDAKGNSIRLGCMYDSYVRQGGASSTTGTIKVRCQYRDPKSNAIVYSPQQTVNLDTCTKDQSHKIVARFDGEGKFQCDFNDPTKFTHDEYMANSFNTWQGDHLLKGEDYDGTHQYSIPQLGTGYMSGSATVSGATNLVQRNGSISNFGLAPLINYYVMGDASKGKAKPYLRSDDRYVRVLQDLGRYVKDNGQRQYDWYFATDIRGNNIQLMSSGYGNENYADIATALDGIVKDRVGINNERVVNRNQIPGFMIIKDHATGHIVGELALRFEDSDSQTMSYIGSGGAVSDATFHRSRHGGLKLMSIGMVPVDSQTKIITPVNHSSRSRNSVNRCNIVQLADGKTVVIGGNAVSWRPNGDANVAKDTPGVIRYELGVLPESQAPWCNGNYFKNKYDVGNKMMRDIVDNPDVFRDFTLMGLKVHDDFVFFGEMGTTMQSGYHQDNNDGEPSLNDGSSMIKYYNAYFRWGELFQIDVPKQLNYRNDRMDNMIYSTYLTESWFNNSANQMTYVNVKKGKAGFERQHLSDSVLFRQTYGGNAEAQGHRFLGLDVDFDVYQYMKQYNYYYEYTLGVYNPNGTEAAGIGYDTALVRMITDSSQCPSGTPSTVVLSYPVTGSNYKYTKLMLTTDDLRSQVPAWSKDPYDNMGIQNCISYAKISVALSKNNSSGKPSVDLITVPLHGYGLSALYKYYNGTADMFQQ